MSKLQETVDIYKKLKAEWSKRPCDLNKCGGYLSTLKVSLTQLSFLPTSNTSASTPELILARDILELGAQWSILKKDIPSFERYMAQLKCYYFDFSGSLAESPFTYQLLGLNLLCLLSQNRVAEFHTELELLPPKEIHNNIYIKHPIALEQYLMEGSYNKVFLARFNVPAESYLFFIDILLDTIRTQIASCISASYVSVTVAEATKLLFYESQSKTRQFAEKIGWKGDGKVYRFSKTDKGDDRCVPIGTVTQHLLEYAKELEMIV